MFKEIFLGREKFFTLNVILFHVAMILMSFMFVYIFSYSTSFRYDMLGGDSSIFQSIGKFWTQGHLPYVELFENKGPLLFLIDAIGYAIYPRAGIMVPQIIFLYLSCLFIWRAMELYSSTVGKIFFLLIALIFYAAHYEEGNHVEEYSVLFLSAAAYVFLRALKDSEGKKFFHPPLYGFIYGFGFGACVLIRTSDAAQICCQTFLAAIFLLQARDFKNLWQNILSFCAGFAAIVLPFVIYFAAHEALYDMIYGTILFNMKYTDASFWLPFKYQVLYNVFHFLPLFIMIIVAALTLKQNSKSRLLWSAIFIGAMMAFLLMKLRPYGHYAMIIFPAMSILFAVLHESRNELQKIWQTSGLSFKRILLKIFIILAVIDIYMSSCCIKELCLNEESTLLLFAPTVNRKVIELNSNEHEEILKLSSIIPEEEKNSFVTWGDYCNAPHWVIYADMKPREREFFLNSINGKIDPAIRKEWFDNVRKDYPLWILYGTDPSRKPGEPPKTPTEDGELEQLLEEKYLFKGEVYIFPQMMKLYRLKE